MTRKLILVYMAGDNNLDVTPEGSYCTRDIIELQRVNFSSDCRCFVQVDRGKTHTAQRCEIVHNPKSQEVRSGDFINIGKINTGDPKVLEAVEAATDFRLSVDLAGLTPGVYTLPVVVKYDMVLTSFIVSPIEVQVTINALNEAF